MTPEADYSYTDQIPLSIALMEGGPEYIVDYDPGEPTFNPSPSVIRTTKTQLETSISLPHLFDPRHYQDADLFQQLFPHHYPWMQALGIERKKRILLLWHRRAGKDLASLSALALEAYERPGNYLYLLPEQTQAKKIIWRGIDGTGIPFLDRIPDAIIRNKFSSEMLIEINTKCGNLSTIQIGGADTYDSWMGTNPQGIIFSEYSLQDPMAWMHFRPILVENGGWAVFIYTARGKNHGYDLYEIAGENPGTWHRSKKTIDDTHRHDGSPVISHEDYLQEIKEGMPEALALQEFYCDFEAALEGSYYGDLMAIAKAEGRVGMFPHNPAKQVFTAWDLGNDANVVIFAQASEGGDPRIIDYIEKPDTPFSEICREVLAKPYTYSLHFGPHDIVNRDHETNTRLNTARDLGLDFVVTPRGSRDDGIEAVRQLLPRTVFHAPGTERLIDVLRSYYRIFDRKLKIFRDIPVHDWASHGSDAFRILAVNWQPEYVDDSWFNRPLSTDTSWMT
jgi:phage terminase large subunit